MPNKGEWGEPYAAIRILGDGKLYIADENDEKNISEWMDVLELIRHETKERIVSYRYDENNVDVHVMVNGTYYLSVPAVEFLSVADALAIDIKSSKKRSFDVSDYVRTFLDKIELKHIKATRYDKSDVFLCVRDPRAGVVRENIGFSIKSEFGQNPTLFNTAEASAFIYKVNGIDDSVMATVNGLCDEKGHAAVMDRCDELRRSSTDIQFYGLPVAKRSKCCAFEENLDLIDPRLISVIEAILWNYFFLHEPCVDIKPLCEKLIETNPCNISRPEIKYPYMMKSFLYATYCGMTASTLWDGKSNVNGGFIKVSADGEVLAHYALESDAFKTYLYNNCYLDFPSTEEKHGNYAKVYKEGNEYFFRLNFQIRYR